MSIQFERHRLCYLQPHYPDEKIEPGTWLPWSGNGYSKCRDGLVIGLERGLAYVMWVEAPDDEEQCKRRIKAKFDELKAMAQQEQEFNALKARIVAAHHRATGDGKEATT